jgi:hypothetical protein
VDCLCNIYSFLTHLPARITSLPDIYINMYITCFVSNNKVISLITFCDFANDTFYKSYLTIYYDKYEIIIKGAWPQYFLHELRFPFIIVTC